MKKTVEDASRLQGRTRYARRHWSPLATFPLLMLLIASVSGCERKVQTSGSQSIYDRVIAAKKIRAAYINYPPGCIVDPKTKQVTGIFPDALRKIAENVGLEVEFTEEVGYGTMIQGLETGRYDMVGSAVWANPVRGKLTALSIPVYYSGVGIWVRANETRFSGANNWETLNSPNVRIAAIDGSTPMVIAKTQFPRAKLVSYPDLTSESQLFLDVVGNKADVFFAEPYQGQKFLKSNPGTIKNLAMDAPIRIFADVFVMPKNEFQLKNMIDTAVQDLQNSGYMNTLIKKYEGDSTLFYRVASPFKLGTPR